MKTDPIFYRLFQAVPGSFFELMGQSATEASAYQFASVELKQTAFRIDGLFLPLPDAEDRPIYFVEVQFQKDAKFYSRFFAEIFLYLHLYQPTQAWRAVVVYPQRSTEPTEVEPYQVLLASPHVQRLYLDELGEAADPSLEIGIVRLIVETEAAVLEQARRLVERSREELADPVLQREIIELIETIVLYKLPQMSREELAAMFSIDDLRQTRFYQEVLQEGREEGREEGRAEGREEGELRGKLAAVPLLLQAGMSIEQIAEQLQVDLAAVRQIGQQQ